MKKGCGRILFYQSSEFWKRGIVFAITKQNGDVSSGFHQAGVLLSGNLRLAQKRQTERIRDLLIQWSRFQSRRQHIRGPVEFSRANQQNSESVSRRLQRLRA